MSEATSVDERLKRLEGDVNQLHDALENKGINSRQVKDALHGRTFQLPVDSEHKAKVMPVWKCGNPHMRAFHASWMGFFTTFLSTFAAAPLATVLKQENTLNLSNDQVATANITSVAFTIVARLGMGVVCDVLGARKGLAFLLLLTVPGIIGIMCVTSAGAFIACRAIIGMSLASFVACQVWCTQQFSSNVVGTANATAGGWGNLGGGVAQLVIPVVYTAFLAATGNNEVRRPSRIRSASPAATDRSAPHLTFASCP
jgi:NNP family nitrate/nitrite transporter-like MFS transporter